MLVGIQLSCAAAMALFVWSQPAVAQTNPADPSADPAAIGGAGADCDTRAALYTNAAGFKLWITRRGTMVEDNPLRPLSHDTKLVLQVAVNGRVATAHGTDFANLHRSGPPHELEATSAGPIRWDAKTDRMPALLRIVSDDGTTLLGPLRLAECGEPPKLAPPPPAKRPARKAGSKPEREPAAVTPPGLTLPRGAIP